MNKPCPVTVTLSVPPPWLLSSSTLKNSIYLYQYFVLCTDDVHCSPSYWVFGWWSISYNSYIVSLTGARLVDATCCQPAETYERAVTEWRRTTVMTVYSISAPLSLFQPHLIQLENLPLAKASCQCAGWQIKRQCLLTLSPDMRHYSAPWQRYMT